MGAVSLADRFSSSPVARYWKDPHKFMPERFLGDWPKDAFMPFSQGLYLRSLQQHNHDLRNITQVPALVLGDGANSRGEN